MTKTLALIVLFFGSFRLSAQSYRPAIVVNNNGDTLKGWIDYQNWNVNPRRIRFKTDSAGSGVVKYGVQDLSYFEIRGLDAYRKAIVIKDMRPVTIEQVNEDTRDSLETDTVFLQTLVKGAKYNLYRLQDAKEHFYLQATGEEPTELSYKMYFDKNSSQVAELFVFRDDLRRIASQDNHSGLDAEIGRAGYSAKSLSRIVMELNGNATAATYSFANKKNQMGPQLFLAAGMNASHFRASGQYTVVGMDYKTAISPSFAIGVDFLSPRNFNDFTFRLELSYSDNTYKGDMTGPSQNTGEPIYSTYTLEQRNITPSVSFLYNLRRRKKVRYYIGAGIAYNFSGYGTNRYTSKDLTGSYSYENTSTDNYLVTRSDWSAILFKIGARLSDSWEIGVTGAPFTTSFVDYHVFSAQAKIYSLRISWFFLNHPKT